jgi:hypothetical protein
MEVLAANGSAATEMQQKDLDHPNHLERVDGGQAKTADVGQKGSMSV